MIGISTQTLDEKPQLLLVVNKTELGAEISSRLRQNLAVEIVSLSWTEFSQKKTKIEKQNWYRQVFVFEHPLDKKHTPLLPTSSGALVLVVVPLTTTVLGGEAQSWVEQVEKEVVFVNQLIEKIDISRFIFYKDLVDLKLFPLKAFLESLDRRILLNPEVDLNLSPLRLVATEVSQQVFKPVLKTRLIQGNSRSSRALVDEIRQTYQQFYQLKLPVRQLGLRISPHPIISRLGGMVEKINLKINQESVLSEISHSLQPAPPITTASTKENMAIPSKNDRLSDWNKTQPQIEPVKIAPEEKLDKLVSLHRAEQKQDHLKELTKKTRLGFRKQEHNKALFIGGLVVSVTATVFLFWFGLYFINATSIKRQLFAEISYSQIAGENNSKLSTSLGKNNWLVNGLNQQALALVFPNLNQLLGIANQINDYEVNSQNSQTIVFKAFQQFLGEETGSSISSTSQLTQLLGEQYQQISLLNAELKNINQEKLSSEYKKIIESYTEKISQHENQLAKLQQLWPLLPDLLASDQQRVYALVLQNNQELRPTGGFIEAVALLTVENGELISTRVESVYDLDSRVFGMVEPPAEIKKFLNEDRWYLRDANWSADFSQSAERIAWFLEQSAKTKIDGVIGLNLVVLEEMLAAMDKVQLPEQNEVITSRNIAERMEYHSELSLSNQNNDMTYSQLVLTRVLSSLNELSSEQVNQLLSGLINQANQQELLLMMKNQDLQTSLDTLGWTGRLVEPNCPVEFSQENCLVDAIAQVEANVGVNKANYYLNRQIDHSIELTADKILHKRVVIFENKAQVESWPKGPYSAYTRFYLSPAARLEKVMINGQPAEVDQILIKQENDRQVVGVYTQTPIKSKTTLQLEYSLKHELEGSFSYVFFDQKQPGARETSPRVFIKHASNLTPTLIAPQAEVQGNVIVFNPTKTLGHSFLGVRF